MSKVVLVMDIPYCCETCRFIEYEPKCRCGILSYKCAKIKDRFSKLNNCPLRELPERKSEEFGQTIINAARAEGWNACLDTIVGGADDA